jgi:uncharacterized protein with GYD domain
MALYFLLGTLNETGQKLLLNNPEQMIGTIWDCHCQGAQILGQHAVLGKYDYVIIAEADDNEAVVRLALEIGVKARLNIETLPAEPIGVLIENGSDDDELDTEFADRPTNEMRLPWGVERRRTSLFKLSLLQPKKLAKGHSSRFIVVIYVPNKSQEAHAWIDKQTSIWPGQKWDQGPVAAELPKDQSVKIELSSEQITFSKEVIKNLRDLELGYIHFDGTPKGTATSVSQDARLSISNAQTGEQYKSWSFQVRIVGSNKTWWTKVVSITGGVAVVGGGLGFITDTLGLIGKIDTVRGAAAGATFGALVGMVTSFMRRISLSRLQLSSVVIDEQFFVHN